MMPDHQGIASLLSDLNLAVQELSAKVDRLAARIEAIEGQRGQFEPAPAPRHQSSPTRPAASLGQSSSSIFDSLATEIPAVLGWAIELCSSLGGQSIIKGEPSVQSLGKQDIGLVSVSRAVSTSAGPPSPLIWPTRRTLCSRPQILSVPCCVSRHLHIVPVSRARFLTASLRRVGPEFIVPLEELHCHQQLINGDHRARGFGRELNIALDLEEEASEAILAQAAILMRREGGLLLALPSGTLSADQLQPTSEGDPFSVFGAKTLATVPAQLLFAEEEVEVLDVLIVDAEVSIRNFMEVMPDPAVPESMITFGSGPAGLPDVPAVMAAARKWIASTAHQAPEMLCGRGAGRRGDYEPHKECRDRSKRHSKAQEQKNDQCKCGREARRGGWSFANSDNSDRCTTEGAGGATCSDAAPCNVPTKSQPDACFSASSEFCEDDGEPSENESTSGCSEGIRAATYGHTHGRGRGGGSSDASRQYAGSCSSPAIEGPYELGE